MQINEEFHSRAEPEVGQSQLETRGCRAGVQQGMGREEQPNTQNQGGCVGIQQAQHPQQPLLIIVLAHDKNLTNLKKTLVFRKASPSSRLSPILLHRMSLSVSLLIILFAALLAIGLVIMGQE